jgi:uncharacterized membrane protein HdeD (DUF308 family)
VLDGARRKGGKLVISDVLTRYWWVVLLRGIAAILFGVLAFLWPAPTIAVLVLFFGAYALADGVLSLIAAFAGRGKHDHWWVLVLEGVAGIVVGVLTFIAPEVTALVLLFYIAAWAIVTGVLEIVAGIRLRHEIEGEALLILGGVLSVLWGLLLMFRPGAGALALLWMIGAFAIVFGVLFVMLSFKLRSTRTPVPQTT